MELKKFRFNWVIIAEAVIGIIGLLIGSFLDQKITGMVSYPDNFCNIFIAAVADIPSLYIGVFIGSVFLFNDVFKNKFVRLLSQIFGALAIISLSVFAYKGSKLYAEYDVMLANELFYKLLLLVFILVSDAVIMILTFKYSKKFVNLELLKVFLAAFFVIAFVAGITEVAKYMMSRPRPSVVVYSYQFQNWWELNPFYALKNDDCKSFFSGHTSNAAALVSAMPLLLAFTKLGKKKYADIIASSAALLFAIIVAITRVCSKAHYLSDVSASFFFAALMQVFVFIVFPLIYDFIEKKQKKNA